MLTFYIDKYKITYLPLMIKLEEVCGAVVIPFEILFSNKLIKLEVKFRRNLTELKFMEN